MRIHGTAIGTPEYASVGENGTRSDGLWASLKSRGQLVSLSSAPLPQPRGWLYRLIAWARFHQSLRFGKVNLRAEVFDQRSRSAVAKIGQAVAKSRANIILEEGFFFSPKNAGLPYAIYVDGTAAMVERHYESLVPWGRLDGGRIKWMQRETDLYRGALRVFTYSDFCRQSICADYGIPEERVTVIYPGLNFKPKPFASTVAVGRYQVVFVGYDFKRKGGEVLLRAWPQVRRYLPNAELVVIGPPTNVCGQIDGVTYVGPVSSREALSKYYASADVFCMPSIFEAYGHVFLEAMAHGLPCVGAASCAMPELIRDGANGLLVIPGNESSLAECLVSILSDHDLRARLRAGAIDTATHWNTWEQVAGQISQQLEADLTYTD